MNPAAYLSIVVNANTLAAQSSLTRLNTQLKATAATAEKSSSRAAAAFKTLGKAGAVAVAVAGVASVKFAADFDKSMRNVNSIAQLSEKQFKSLEDQVLSLAGKTAQAPNTLAEGLYDLVSSGFKADDAIKVLAASAKGATAGLTDTATSTKAVAAVLNAYRFPASKAKQVTDELFQTVNIGVISFEELASTIGNVLPAATTLGVKLPEVGAAISTLTKEGQSGATAVTNINAAMTALFKPSADMKTALHSVGYESAQSLIQTKGFEGALRILIGTTDGSAESIGKLFNNVRAQRAVFGLTGKNAKDAAKDLAAFKDSSGATNKVLAEQKKSFSYQWNKFKAGAEASAIAVGQKLLPVLIDVLKLFQGKGPIAKFFSQFSEQWHTLRDNVVRYSQGIADAASGAFDSIKQATPGVVDALKSASSATADAASSGFSAFIDAIRGSVQWLSMAAKNVSGFVQAIYPLKVAFAAAAVVMIGMWDSLKTGIKLIITAASVTKDLLANAFRFAGSIIGAFATQIKDLGRIFGDVVGIITNLLRGDFSGAWKNVKELVGSILRLFTDQFKGMANIARTGLSAVANSVKSVFSGAFSAIGDILSGAFGAVKDVLSKAAEKLSGPVHTVAHVLTWPIKTAFSAVKDAVVFAMDKILGAVSSALGVAGDIASKLSGIPGVGGKFDDLADAAHSAQESIDNFRDHLKGQDAEQAKKRALGDVQDAFKALDRVVGDNGKNLDKWYSKTKADLQGGVDASKAFSKGFGLAFGQVKDASQSAGKAVGKGISRMGAATDAALEALGAKGVAFAAKAVALSQGSNAPKRAYGGLVPGNGNVDNVPLHIGGELAAWVKPKEMVSVLNPAATAKLMAFNKANPPGSVPGYAKGGVVGNTKAMLSLANAFEHAHEPYLWGGGHGSFATSPTPVDCSGFVSGILHAGGLLNGAPMVSGSLMGWGKPARGNEWLQVAAGPGHTVMKLGSDVYGTSGTNPQGGAGLIEGVRNPLSLVANGVLRTMDTAAAQKIKRMLMTGPDGAFKSIGQGIFDKVHSAAQSYLNKAMPSGSFGGGDHFQGGKTFSASWYGRGAGTIGGSGQSLPGTMSFAELSNPPSSLNFSALGGLPYGKHIGVTYKDKTIDVEKLDVGAGGPGLNGHVRAVDLWEDAARKLPGFIGAGLADVQVSGLAKGGIVPMLAKGGLTANISNVVHKAGKAKHRKVKKALHKLLGRLKGNLALDPALQKEIARLTGLAEISGDYADRASTIGGLVNGKSETQWLQAELMQMWGLRNLLIKAYGQSGNVKGRAERITKDAQKELRDISKRLRTTEGKRKVASTDLGHVQDRLGTIHSHISDLKGQVGSPHEVQQRADRIGRLRDKLAKAKPKDRAAIAKDLQHALHDQSKAGKAAADLADAQKKESEFDTLRKHLRAQLERLGSTSRTLTARQSILKDKILPALDKRSSAIGSGRSGILTDLEDLQGKGSSMEILKKLPPLDAIGGSIFDVRWRLAELGKDTTGTPATEIGGVSISQISDLLQAFQYGVFQNSPIMHMGGIVPGPRGADVPIIAQAGEGIVPASAMNKSYQPVINVYLGNEKLDAHTDYRIEVHEHAAMVREEMGVGQ